MRTKAEKKQQQQLALCRAELNQASIKPSAMSCVEWTATSARLNCSRNQPFLIVCSDGTGIKPVLDVVNL
jgi:hypothetical protein